MEPRPRGHRSGHDLMDADETVAVDLPRFDVRRDRGRRGMRRGVPASASAATW